MDKIKFIQEKCIEANPEIVELKFGCEIKHNASPKDDGRYVSEKDGNHWYCTNEGVIYPILEEHIEIIGRPIRLADVLMAISSLNKGNKINDFNKLEYGISGGGFYIGNCITHDSMDWYLKDNNLENQPEETIDFIYDILKD